MSSKPRTIYLGAALACASIILISCAGNRPANLGASETGLAPCPSSPNCVSSDARDKAHQVPAFDLIVPPAEAWPVARELVSELPRTRIVHEQPGYLHAECSSLLGFVDDLELDLRPVEGIIAVRSASRLGYWDFGVNRRRLEALRNSLIEREIVR